MANLLSVTGLSTGYGKKQVLFGISADVAKGEVVALLGPNGAGKSTVLKAVAGLIPAWEGSILFDDSPIVKQATANRIAHGITFAPQGNRTFQNLTVKENLEIGGFHLPKVEARERISEMLSFFPNLRNQLQQDAGRLSGGEQQMVALARALIAKPKLLMLDEPSLGLSPNLVQDVLEKVKTISEKTGVAVLVVEQKVREVLEICDRVYSLKLGRVAFCGLPDELKVDKRKLKELFV